MIGDPGRRTICVSQREKSMIKMKARSIQMAQCAWSPRFRFKHRRDVASPRVCPAPKCLCISLLLLVTKNRRDSSDQTRSRKGTRAERVKQGKIAKSGFGTSQSYIYEIQLQLLFSRDFFLTYPFLNSIISVCCFVNLSSAVDYTFSCVTIQNRRRLDRLQQALLVYLIACIFVYKYLYFYIHVNTMCVCLRAHIYSRYSFCVNIKTFKSCVYKIN